jgi:hypothetical protein
MAFGDEFFRWPLLPPNFAPRLRQYRYFADEVLAGHTTFRVPVLPASRGSQHADCVQEARSRASKPPRLLTRSPAFLGPINTRHQQ